jgi:hypothetical protein
MATRLRFALAPLLLAISLTPPAHADWQYTNWGMTLEEVLAASSGVAVRLSEAETAAKAAPGSTRAALLKAPYASGKFQFTAYFRFDQRTGELASVELDLRQAELSSELLGALRQKYGEPRSEQRSQITNIVVWNADEDQISYVWLLTPMTRIDYQPLRSQDNAGL